MQTGILLLVFLVYLFRRLTKSARLVVQREIQLNEEVQRKFGPGIGNQQENGMQIEEHLQQLSGDLKSVRDNLKKDSSARREDANVTERNVSELEQFRSYLGTLKNNFQMSADKKGLSINRITLGKDLIGRGEA